MENKSFFIWWFEKKCSNLHHHNKRKNEINSLQYVLYDAGIFRRDTIVVYFQTYI